MGVSPTAIPVSDGNCSVPCTGDVDTACGGRDCFALYTLASPSDPSHTNYYTSFVESTDNKTSTSAFGISSVTTPTGITNPTASLSPLLSTASRIAVIITSTSSGAIFILFVLCCVRRRRRKKEKQQRQEEKDPSDVLVLTVNTTGLPSPRKHRASAADSATGRSSGAQRPDDWRRFDSVVIDGTQHGSASSPTSTCAGHLWELRAKGSSGAALSAWRRRGWHQRRLVRVMIALHPLRRVNIVGSFQSRHRQSQAAATKDRYRNLRPRKSRRE